MYISAQIEKYLKYLKSDKFCWYLVNKGGEGNGTPLQYSCLENPMDRGTWQATVHGVTKSQTQLSMNTYTALLSFRITAAAAAKSPQ